MHHLSLLSSTADAKNEGEVGSELADLQARYERLQALPVVRLGLLEDFLPSVQQYESSRGAWLDLLCGWEMKMEQPSSPTVTPKAILTQLNQIKVIHLRTDVMLI